MVDSGTPQTAFIGRDEETAFVTDLVRDPDTRLVTITGTGGIGKTRLAWRVASVADDAFPDGVTVVPLATIRDPAQVLPTIAMHLGVPGAADRSLPDRVQAFLVGRRLLLVLDNFEHLLDAASTVADLIAANPGLTALCTSRARLNLSVERVVPLAPLPAPDARRLFAVRAEAQLPRFMLLGDIFPTVDAICRRLDYLPLAIELAAARIPMLPPPALLRELEHSLDVLASGPRDAPERLRTMRDAIAWSHDLLTPDQQAVFRSLGVFIGGFTLEAAKAVAGEQVATLDGIATLVATNLIVPVDGVAGEPRFVMLETIREFALEQLEASGEIDSARGRHATYFRELSESMLPLYDGPHLRTALDRVEVELGNCRAAMTQALEIGDAETGIRLAGALWRVWRFSEVAGMQDWSERIAEGRAWTERMLAMDPGLPVEAVTEAYIGAFRMARLQDDLNREREVVDTLLARARAESYPYGCYWALQGCGMHAQDDGKFDIAEACFEEMVTLAPNMRESDNHEAIARLNLGMTLLRAGRRDDAEAQLELARRLCRATGNPTIGAVTVSLLGHIQRERGRLVEAAAWYGESLLGFRTVRDFQRVHRMLVELAIVALQAGLPERSARLLGVTTTVPNPPVDVLEIGLELPDRDAALKRTRGQLGNARFEAAYDAGRAVRPGDLPAEVEALVTEIRTGAGDDQALRHGLSRRELEVLRLLAEGRTNRAIAEALSLSERTIENHVLRILTKLDRDTRTAAAIYAVRHGLA